MSFGARALSVSVSLAMAVELQSQQGRQQGTGEACGLPGAAGEDTFQGGDWLMDRPDLVGSS